MDISGLIRNFKYETDKKNYDLELLGREVKKKRREQNLTLKECSNENLSISYLSKIENNKLMPNLQVANELIEKFKIDTKIFDDLEIYEKYVNTCIQNIYFNNKDYVVKIFTKANQKVKLNLNLLNYIYWIYRNKFDDIDDLYSIIYESKMTLKNIEIESFIIFTFIYKVKIHNFIDAYKLLNLINKIPIKNFYLNELKEYYSLKLYKNEVFNIYFLTTIEQLLSNAFKVDNFHLIEKLRAEKIIFLAENNFIYKAKEEYKTYSKQLFINNKNAKKEFLLEFNYITRQNLKNIKTLESMQILLLTGTEFIYLLKAHFEYKNIEKIKEYLQFTTKFLDELNYLDIIYINFLSLFVENQNEKLKKYLTTICFETFIKQGDLKNVQFYKNQLEIILLKEAKYKKFYLLEDRYNKKLLQISEIYDKNN